MGGSVVTEPFASEGVERVLGRLDVVATRVVLCGKGTAEPAAVTRDELPLVPDPFGIDAETVLLGLKGYVEVLLNGCELGGAGREGAVTDCWEVR